VDRYSFTVVDSHHRLLAGLPAHSNKRMGAKAGFVPRFCHHDTRGRHQFSWHKKQEHSRIFPSDTVVVLTGTLEDGLSRISYIYNQ
jgi:hypothetical protein